MQLQSGYLSWQGACARKQKKKINVRAPQQQMRFRIYIFLVNVLMMVERAEGSPWHTRLGAGN